jgi:hypothetical protein
MQIPVLDHAPLPKRRDSFSCDNVVDERQVDLIEHFTQTTRVCDIAGERLANDLADVDIDGDPSKWIRRRFRSKKNAAKSGRGCAE